MQKRKLRKEVKIILSLVLLISGIFIYNKTVSKKDNQVEFIYLNLNEVENTDLIFKSVYAEELESNNKKDLFVEVVVKEASEKEIVNYDDEIEFDENGLLVMEKSDLGQEVINLLLAIPEHKNGSWCHEEWKIDKKIDQMTTKQALWSIWRIEGAGLGQTSDGYAGIDSYESHHNFVDVQINNRFGGSVHELLKHWGTYNYSGY